MAQQGRGRGTARRPEWSKMGDGAQSERSQSEGSVQKLDFMTQGRAKFQAATQIALQRHHARDWETVQSCAIDSFSISSQSFRSFLSLNSCVMWSIASLQRKFNRVQSSCLLCQFRNITDRRAWVRSHPVSQYKYDFSVTRGLTLSTVETFPSDILAALYWPTATWQKSTEIEMSGESSNQWVVPSYG